MRQLQFLVVLLLSTMSTISFAQEKKTVHEIGLNLTNLTNLTDFTLDYKVGSNNKFFHVRALGFSGSTFLVNPNNVNDQDRFSTSMSLGYESRFKLYKTLNGIIGTGLRLSYTSFKQGSYISPIPNHTFTSGVYISLGVNLIIKDRLSMSLSLSPSVNTIFSFDETELRDVRLSYGLDIAHLSLTIAYRLEVEKKK